MSPVVHKLGVIRSSLSTSKFKSFFSRTTKNACTRLAPRIMITVNTNQDARTLQLPSCLSSLNHNLSVATSKFYKLISVYCHSVNMYLLESSILQLT